VRRISELAGGGGGSDQGPTCGGSHSVDVLLTSATRAAPAVGVTLSSPVGVENSRPRSKPTLAAAWEFLGGRLERRSSDVFFNFFRNLGRLVCGMKLSSLLSRSIRSIEYKLAAKNNKLATKNNYTNGPEITRRIH
jgi:hypothetical protein